MNLIDNRYSEYALVKEMLQTVDVVRHFDPSQTETVAAKIRDVGKLHFTGEGSSRILPTKNAIRRALTWGMNLAVSTDGSWQSSQYDLSTKAVFCASNSGRTKEVVMLAKKLGQIGNNHRYALTANSNTLLEQACSEAWVLQCGLENAVAATKSVVEQTLFYESILWNIAGKDLKKELSGLSEKMQEALTMSINPEITNGAVAANTIYIAGYNDGVAEELTLKTNEITRKKSDYLEGTYAAHGIEEVMEKSDFVVIIDPIEEEYQKFHDILEKGVGLKVVAIADRDTPFTTIKVPNAGILTPYVYLCAGWNLLVEIGLQLGINLDKPVRARKVGNEFVG